MSVGSTPNSMILIAMFNWFGFRKYILQDTMITFGCQVNLKIRLLSKIPHNSATECGIIKLKLTCNPPSWVLAPITLKVSMKVIKGES